jgi:hypothetical protein
MLFLKEKDTWRLNDHIKKLGETLVHASKTELQLNEKTREMAKVKHELATTRCRNEFLEK